MQRARSITRTVALAIIIFAIGACGGGGGGSPTELVPNLAPQMVSVDGPRVCETGKVCTFTATGIDPDGNQVSFHVNVRQAGNLALVEDLGWGPYVANNAPDEWALEWRWGTGHFKICYHVKDGQGQECDESGHRLHSVRVSS